MNMRCHCVNAPSTLKCNFLFVNIGGFGFQLGYRFYMSWVSTDPSCTQIGQFLLIFFFSFALGSQPFGGSCSPFPLCFCSSYATFPRLDSLREISACGGRLWGAVTFTDCLPFLPIQSCRRKYTLRVSALLLVCSCSALALCSSMKACKRCHIFFNCIVCLIVLFCLVVAWVTCIVRVAMPTFWKWLFHKPLPNNYHDAYGVSLGTHFRFRTKKLTAAASKFHEHIPIYEKNRNRQQWWSNIRWRWCWQRSSLLSSTICLTGIL